MSLQAILDAITADGTAQVEQIEVSGQKVADEIIVQANAIAKQEHDHHMAGYQAQANRERNRILQIAQQDALSVINIARDAFVNEVLKQLRNQLQTVRDERRYATAFQNLVFEALDSLSTSLKANEHPQLYADPRDEHLLRDINPNADLHYTINCIGGVTASTPDGRVTVDNTINQRLERATPQIRQMIVGVLSQDGV